MKEVASSIRYVLFLVMVVIVFDVLVLKHILNLGYYRHFEEENIQRHPVPYVMFSGKPNAGGHNELGFKGLSFSQAPPDAFKIAFFGGSTGYFGNPTVAETLETELDKVLPIDTFVANYSVLSSNHRQHLHGIIEYLLNMELDLVVFYGGYNETIQTMIYDPRPGYPYNYFFRSEMSTGMKLLLENSAIIGTLDKVSGIFSGRYQLRELHQPLSDQWNENILRNYFETLDFANRVVGILPSIYCSNTQFLAFYQPYRVPEEFLSTHEAIKEHAATLEYVVDVSSTFDAFPEDVFKDRVHVVQEARNAMGRRIAEGIVQSLFEKEPAICHLPPQNRGKP